MTRFLLSREARNDLKSIYRYVAEHSASATGRLHDLFFAKFRLLSAHPLLGDTRDDLAIGIRAFTAAKYVILYRPMTRGIIVVQIAHSAQDLATVFRR
jgi:toxin ParE1/3/4